MMGAYPISCLSDVSSEGFGRILGKAHAFFVTRFGVLGIDTINYTLNEEMVH